ncbi:hypothetical protein [Gelidibacter salicanalis]|uniref:DNA mismatch repair protein MutS n=1 Tax=Gelidibacter salicanalis TaxID=291193 RepID=A0A934KSK1_9FLAO|nr:hypothetical protein [Gelidibacter salicanalis]MBJ7880631.1 hypothetical protein [Gelidibacter salicanalis]
MKIYRDKIKSYDAKLLDISKVLNRLSFLRLFIFVTTIILLIFLFSVKLFTLFFIVFPISILIFIIVLKHHTKIAYLRKHTSFLKRINEFEILREQCNLEEFDTGKKFSDPNHPYTSDLDIFGEHSIFQLVNRTTTESGEILLSEWLSEAAPIHGIKDRQEAIKELSQKLEWRQDFQASGMHFQNKKSDYYKLLSWVEGPLVLLKNRRIYIAVALLLPVLFIFSAYFFYVNLGSIKAFIFLSFMILVVLINYMILRKLNSIAENISETSTKNLTTLRGYQALINNIESESFKSERLNALQSIVTKDKFSVSKEIKGLCRLLEFSELKTYKKNTTGWKSHVSVIK